MRGQPGFFDVDERLKELSAKDQGRRAGAAGHPPQKPPGKPMPRHIARANSRKSKVRAAVEPVFARQKGPMALVVRTIGSAPRHGEDRHGQPRPQDEPGCLARPQRGKAGLRIRAEG